MSSQQDKDQSNVVALDHSCSNTATNLHTCRTLLWFRSEISYSFDQNSLQFQQNTFCCKDTSWKTLGRTGKGENYRGGQTCKGDNGRSCNGARPPDILIVTIPLFMGESGTLFSSSWEFNDKSLSGYATYNDKRWQNWQITKRLSPNIIL